MKESSGEANLTVVTIILIGVVVAVATPLINSLMTNSKQRSCCLEAGGYPGDAGCTGDGFNEGTYNSCMGI